MKRKIRIALIQTVEYEPEVKYYDGAKTTLDMAEIDASTDDIEVLFQQGKVDFKIQYEAFEEVNGEMVSVGSGEK